MRWTDQFFMIPASNEQATAAIGIHPTKALIVTAGQFQKMLSGPEDTLEEWYAIKFCFKLGKNDTETYGMLQNAFQPSCMKWASVFEWHKKFKEGRESVRDDETWGGGVRKSEHQSWFTK